jgi:hypothetical protein
MVDKPAEPTYLTRFQQRAILVKFSNMASILSISTKKEMFISMKNKYFSITC